MLIAIFGFVYMQIVMCLPLHYLCCVAVPPPLSHSLARSLHTYVIGQCSFQFNFITLASRQPQFVLIIEEWRLDDFKLIHLLNDELTISN